MKLNTELHKIKVLHVEVPPEINASEFELEIGYVAPEGDPLNLKNGITVNADCFHDWFADAEFGITIQELLIQRFLGLVANHKPVPDEFFFHR